MGKWIFLALSLIGMQDASANRGPIIRVRIAKALSSLVVSGDNLKAKSPIIMGLNEREGKRTLRFNCRGHDLTKKSNGSPTLLASLSSDSGVIRYANAPYLGNMDLLVSGQGDACDVVNSLPMDSYISSLLAKEMNAHWPIEALKAQAVAARTYALFQMDGKEAGKNPEKTFFDLENSEKYQVNGSLLDTNSTTWKASMDTSGEVLLNAKGTIIPAFFHAQCGGRTFTPGQIWGNNIEGYRNVLCPNCQGIGKGMWKKDLFSAELISAFYKVMKKGNTAVQSFDNNSANSAPIIYPHQRLDSNIRVFLQGKILNINKAELRNILGRELLPSNNFRIIQAGSKYMVEGIGNGNGVGMCQIGALTMAKQGKNYKEILQNYFPGLKLQKVY